MLAALALYGLVAAILAVGLLVGLVFFLFRRCYYGRKENEKNVETGTAVNGAATGTDVSAIDDYYSTFYQKRLIPSPNNYSGRRNITMDSMANSKPLTKIQSVQPFPRSPATRQKSFPLPPRSSHDNGIFEKVPEEQSIDEYDTTQKRGLVQSTPDGRTSRTNSTAGDLRRQGSTSTEASIGSIKPDLYLRKGSLFFQHGEGGESSCIGKVHLRFRYDFRRSDFLVTAIQAELAPNVQECYLRMFLSPEDSDSATGCSSGSSSNQKVYRQSTVRRRSAAFAFNEEFKFPVAFAELIEKTLVVQAFDCSPRSATSRAHQQLGVVCLELRKADPSADIEVLADLAKMGDDDDVYGSMELALSYLPSVQRLTVSILQAKGLQADDLLSDHPSGTTAVYVRCWLLQRGNKVSTKKKKTGPVTVLLPPHIQQSKFEATWKEQLTFHLNETACKSANLRILVCAKNTKGGLEKVLGELNLSSEESDRGCRQHWKQMLKEKMELSAWHRLQTPMAIESFDRRDSFQPRMSQEGEY